VTGTFRGEGPLCKLAPMREAVTFDDEDEDNAAKVPSTVTLGQTDWTAETMISAIKRETIQLSPRFQRRDAWDLTRKSRFIESLVVGLPIPQIVLAESIKERSKFIVLDGKQRLLSLLQFWGMGDGRNNAFALKGLELDDSLRGVNYQTLSTNQKLRPKYDALLNQTIRTVVIKGWRDLAFLHTVFLRLNTGSLPLSPQELRQAAFPGDYTDALDDFSVASKPLQDFLGLKEPDYRMRDVELVARFVSFALFLDEYTGRMKPFLDTSFEKLNKSWKSYKARIEALFSSFEAALASMEAVFGAGKVARKEGSNQLNKAIFDALIFYFRLPELQKVAPKHKKALQEGYAKLLGQADFLAAVERATADVPNTFARLSGVGGTLEKATGIDLPKPELRETTTGQRIVCA
jgi:hypothetical protein